VLQGEVVGIFEIAELADRVSESAITSSVAKQHAESVPAPMTRLLQLGDSLRSKGQIDQAIQVYDTVLQQDPNNKVALQRRGAAYLARGREGDVDRALTDQKAAGLPGIKLSIRSTSSELKLGNTATGEVGKGEIVRVTQSNGNWLWVDSVDGNNSLKGWITKEAVIAKRVDAAKPKPSGYQRSSQWTAPRPNTHQFRGSGDRFIDNYIQKHGRPPSIWETPRWESLREIERLRNSGFLR